MTGSRREKARRIGKEQKEKGNEIYSRPPRYSLPPHLPPLLSPPPNKTRKACRNTFEFGGFLFAGKVEPCESFVGLKEMEEWLHVGDVVEPVVQFLFPHFLTLRHVVNPNEVRPNKYILSKLR